MSVTSDIVESWRRPRVVVRRLLERGGTEAFVLTFLVIFLLLAFVARAPVLARDAFLDPSDPLPQLLFAAALGLLATLPVWYLLAAVSHMIARACGGKGGHYGARLALFWALVVISPAMLVHGLVLAMADNPVFSALLGVGIGAGFVMLWIVMLIEVER
jgi:hypothetical protein